MFSAVAYAAGTTVESLYEGLKNEILYPIIAAGFAIALVYFLYNGFKYMVNVSTDKRKEYQKGLLYGILGLAIMSAATGLVSLIQSTVNSLAR